MTTTIDDMDLDDFDDDGGDDDEAATTPERLSDQLLTSKTAARSSGRFMFER